MKINHNMAALITNKQLLRTENSLSATMERLSSGLKINHAKDDAAGLAVSSKMNTQISGINRSSQNASDGISMIETADGALSEMTSVLQRMRELSVQAANDTNTPLDRRAIQEEIASLKDEVDRIAKDTEYNTKSLLDGNLDTRVYPSSTKIERMQVSDEVPVFKYQVSILNNSRQAVLLGYPGNTGGGLKQDTDPTTGASVDQIDASAAGKLKINGYEIEINEGDTQEEVYDKLKKGGELAGVYVFARANDNIDLADPEKEKAAGYEVKDFEFGDSLTFVSERYGANASVELECDNPQLADLFGISSKAVANGIDVSVKVDKGFSKTTSIKTEGQRIEITDNDGFKMSFMAKSNLANTTYEDRQMDASGITNDANPAITSSTSSSVTLEVTDVGKLTLQVGARENQNINVTIPDTSVESLYIEDLDVEKVGGADRAIASLDDAISMVNTVRSKLGAYENRLDSAVSSLDQAEENLTTALSRIIDADMAIEMTDYTKLNVLTQAATSVLSQANDQPQQVLQLLS